MAADSNEDRGIKRIVETLINRSGSAEQHRTFNLGSPIHVPTTSSVLPIELNQKTPGLKEGSKMSTFWWRKALDKATRVSS
jgi:hypothetical protein